MSKGQSIEVSQDALKKARDQWEQRATSGKKINVGLVTRDINTLYKLLGWGISEGIVVAPDPFVAFNKHLANKTCFEYHFQASTILRVIVQKLNSYLNKYGLIVEWCKDGPGFNWADDRWYNKKISQGYLPLNDLDVAQKIGYKLYGLLDDHAIRLWYTDVGAKKYGPDFDYCLLELNKEYLKLEARASWALANGEVYKTIRAWINDSSKEKFYKGDALDSGSNYTLHTQLTYLKKLLGWYVFNGDYEDRANVDLGKADRLIGTYLSLMANCSLIFPYESCPIVVDRPCKIERVADGIELVYSSGLVIKPSPVSLKNVGGDATGRVKEIYQELQSRTEKAATLSSVTSKPEVAKTIAPWAGPVPEPTRSDKASTPPASSRWQRIAQLKSLERGNKDE